MVIAGWLSPEANQRAAEAPPPAEPGFYLRGRRVLDPSRMPPGWSPRYDRRAASQKTPGGQPGAASWSEQRTQANRGKPLRIPAKSPPGTIRAPGTPLAMPPQSESDLPPRQLSRGPEFDPVASHPLAFPEPQTPGQQYLVTRSSSWDYPQHGFAAIAFPPPRSLHIAACN